MLIVSCEIKGHIKHNYINIHQLITQLSIHYIYYVPTIYYTWGTEQWTFKHSTDACVSNNDNKHINNNMHASF